MKTQEFLDLLEKNPNKELVFEFRKDEFVPKSFHITEIKSQHVKSVDCGGFQHDYDETVVQLWIPDNEKKDKGMEASKALKIFNIVNKKNPLNSETPIFFEFGYADLATSIYDVQTVEQSNDQILIKMFVPATACKPKLTLENAIQVGQNFIEKGKSVCCGPNSSCC